MKNTKWLKKSLVVLISVLTFGMVSPADLTWFGEDNSAKAQKKDAIEGSQTFQYEASIENYQTELPYDQFIESMMIKAEENAYMKFGEKIKPKIELEFKSAILPKIENAIQEMAEQYPEEKLTALSITEEPASGRGEKIFHIYNQTNGEDTIRFHVRQENPPQEGYWFDFHYHTYHDNFVEHHELGKIYWDKNTPPKWENREKILS